MDVHPDTIPVRDEERFDQARLAAYLRGRLPGTEHPLQVRQFGEGKANLTYLLDYGTHQYVLRRPPLGPVAPKAHDMGREHRVLSRLWRAYPLAPRSLLYCDDPNVIGAPFHVMERRRGIVVRQAIPDAYAHVPDAPRRMAWALVDALAELHGVDHGAIGLEDLGRPQGFIRRQIEGWWKRWQAARLEELPAMEAVYRWLQENGPPEHPGTLVHNDYKLDNLMLHPQDPGRAVAVLDWDMCTLGDPLSDVGALLAYWVQVDDPPHMRALAMMPVDPRFPSREALVARYAERSGRDVAAIRFYHALSLYRVAVIIAQIYIRYVRGQTRDRRFASFGSLIPLTAQAALDVAQGRMGL